jgi:predicted secreted protein
LWKEQIPQCIISGTHSNFDGDSFVTFETIRVNVGEDFTVRLKSTPTTGFIWTTHDTPMGLELLGSESEKLLGDAQAGDPVTQVFRFRALGIGDFSIHFHLKRLWENHVADTQIVIVKVS